MSHYVFVYYSKSIWLPMYSIFEYFCYGFYKEYSLNLVNMEDMEEDKIYKENNYFFYLNMLFHNRDGNFTNIWYYNYNLGQKGGVDMGLDFIDGFVNVDLLSNIILSQIHQEWMYLRDFYDHYVEIKFNYLEVYNMLGYYKWRTGNIKSEEENIGNSVVDIPELEAEVGEKDKLVFLELKDSYVELILGPMHGSDFFEIPFGDTLFWLFEYDGPFRKSARLNEAQYYFEEFSGARNSYILMIFNRILLGGFGRGYV